VVSEPNITLLLETTLFAASVKDGRITDVTARCDKSEHLYRIRAKMFCDCTGDSRLGLEAGADMRTGREARAEFGESLAPETPDNRTLGSSILFTSRLHRQPMPFTPPGWARRITKQQLLHRPITSWEYGYWWIEWGGDKDIIADSERIRFELLSIVMGVWDYIKNSGDFPDSRYWAMDWVGMMPGKRGSRRLLGDYILRQQDLMAGSFPDAVAIGGWPMDGHPPEGFDRPDLPPNTVLRPPEVYDIPLRSLYSRNLANLWMAGRMKPPRSLPRQRLTSPGWRKVTSSMCSASCSGWRSWKRRSVSGFAASAVCLDAADLSQAGMRRRRLASGFGLTSVSPSPSNRPSWARSSSLRTGLPLLRSTSRVGKPAGPPENSSLHCRSATSTGKTPRPFGVKTYSR